MNGRTAQSIEDSLEETVDRIGKMRLIFESRIREDSYQLRISPREDLSFEDQWDHLEDIALETTLNAVMDSDDGIPILKISKI